MKFFKARNVCYFLFIANFFLISCSTSTVESTKNLSSKKINTLVTEGEREWMDKFFKEFFLESAAIYTLFGSKPISGQSIIYISSKEYQKNVIALLEKEGIKGEKKEKMLSEMTKEHLKYDFHKNWEKWISFIDRYPNSPFIFAKRRTLSKNLWTGYILNVQETIWILQKYYNIFKNELGFDFDPVSATIDFKNEDSLFWKKVFSNHLLSGIVYGYGYKNSYFFNMYIKVPKESLEKYSFFSSLIRKREQDNESHSITDIILPRFRSFGLPFNNDPIVEKYKLERKKIIKNLNKSNFFETVLLQLVGELSQEKISKN